jgi:hypothetical protein
MGRVDGKAVGDYGFITCQTVGLADGARADAIPHAVGGEGGHGAARVDGVIHRSRHANPSSVFELPSRLRFSGMSRGRHIRQTFCTRRHFRL